MLEAIAGTSDRKLLERFVEKERAAPPVLLKFSERGTRQLVVAGRTAKDRRGQEKKHSSYCEKS